MPIVTYLPERRYEEMETLDEFPELNELYKEVRKEFPEIYVDCTPYWEKRWFKRNRLHHRFTIYNRINVCESQILLVPNEEVIQEVLAAYLYGVLTGLDIKK